MIRKSQVAETASDV